MSYTFKLALGSIIIGILVFALKTLAWSLTNSVALLSDAMESIVNITASLVAVLAIRLAEKPADANHPYGHHKAEFFSATAEGVLIIIAALFILKESFTGFIYPQEIDTPFIGLLFNAGASIINGIWCWILISQGRRHRSPALIADGHHLLSDVWTSVGVLAGVTLASFTGWTFLDPLLATLVALNILFAGWKVIKKSLSGLLDEHVPAEDLKNIKEIILNSSHGSIEAHDLRTRHAGRMVFVEFHLVVEGSMSVSESHDICDRIELNLRSYNENMHIQIHVEPEEKAKHTHSVISLLK